MPQGLCCLLGTVSPAGAAPVRPLKPLHPSLRFLEKVWGGTDCPAPLGFPTPPPPSIVRSGKREGQSGGQSSAPDTRWLRGSPRFSKAATGFLSPPCWWALPGLSSAGSPGRRAGGCLGLGTGGVAQLPGPARPVTSSQAGGGAGGAREAAAGQGHLRGTVGHETVLSPWWGGGVSASSSFEFVRPL